MPQTILLRLGLVAALLVAGAGRSAGQAVVTIDGAHTYQVIDGFGVNANYWSWNGTDLQPVLDALIDQAGMTLFRVIFNEGWETNNDNSDSSVMNWDYYNQVYSGPDAEKLWSLMGYLNQRGITNGIMPNFQGYGRNWLVTWPNTLTPGNENEWAEAIASLLVYARNNRHLQFNLVAPQNEPDVGGEGIYIPMADQYLTALRCLAQQLDTNGLGDVRFVGPDRVTAGTNWLPEMLSDPVVMSKLGHFGVHSYSGGGGGSSGVYGFLQGSAYPDRTFWMTEFNVWCQGCEEGLGGTNNWDYFRGTAEYLLNHLANGASGGLVWEGYDSYYPHHGSWSFWGLLAVNNPYVQPRTYTPRKNFYTLAQITKFVRPGARRIKVNGSTNPLFCLAFYHPDSGQLTLVGENTSSSQASLGGILTNLPPVARLDLYYTDRTTNLGHSAAFPLTNAAFATTVPGDCIFTLVGFDPAKVVVSVLITNPVEGARFSAPASIPVQAVATTTAGTIASVEFSCGTNVIGQTAAPPYDLTWSNVAPGSYVVAARATNSIGGGGLSPGVRVVVTGPAVQIAVEPNEPLVVPYGSVQFVATATDALGNALEPPPPFAWSASGGGSINENGLFTAGPCASGPFVISAHSGVIAGTASLWVTNSLNLAPEGTGCTWYGMEASTNSSPQALAPGINDGDFQMDVPLLTGDEQDTTNAYEAAGVIWATPQTIGRVTYYNGSYTIGGDGVFADEFGLQFSPDGTTWTNAGPAWTVAPAYVYNSSSSANASFTFTGPTATVRGIRCVGRVHTADTDQESRVAFATELQALAAAPAGLTTQISITPSNAMIVPYGSQQFSVTATDAFGDLLTPQPAFAWSVSGGGSIDASGRFTARGGEGGPFTIAASACGFTSTAGISITANLDLSPAGFGCTWYSLTASTGNSPQALAPGINDGDLETDVPLVPGGIWDTNNAYEAAGVIWSTPQTIDRVIYYNGSYTEDEDGVFAADFGLQFSPDGSTWTNAGPTWTNSPAYVYNSASSANTNFTFTGSAVTVRGVRCVGRVYTRKISAWVAFATELQAFAAPVLPLEPIITSQPMNQAALVGATMNFSVAAIGVEPLSYQWQFNGTNLDGATANALALSNLQVEQAGGYRARISNPNGIANSTVAILTVLHYPLLLAARTTTDGTFGFTLSGDPGFTYVIEVSTNLAEWSPLSTLSNATGQADFTDSTSSDSRSRFYRARLEY